MEESELVEQLNRLISGELSDEEAAELTRRMLQNPEMRKVYDRLQAVDELLREAYLNQQSDDGQEGRDGVREGVALMVASTADGELAGDHEKAIEEIVRKIFEQADQK